jgi:hypothetical protein
MPLRATHGSSLCLHCSVQRNRPKEGEVEGGVQALDVRPAGKAAAREEAARYNADRGVLYSCVSAGEWLKSSAAVIVAKASVVGRGGEAARAVAVCDGRGSKRGAPSGAEADGAPDDLRYLLCRWRGMFKRHHHITYHRL